MVKLNRTTEYGLIALRHMNRKRGFSLGDTKEDVTSAREVAEFYGLPFEIMAKTLQKLKDVGLLRSAHGARGGYSMAKPLEQVSLAQFLEWMEGPQSIVHCAMEDELRSQLPLESYSGLGRLMVQSSQPLSQSSSVGCEYQKRCEVKDWMVQLNTKIFTFLSSISLAELVPFETVLEETAQK